MKKNTMKKNIIIWGLTETGLAVARSVLARRDLNLVAALAVSTAQQGKDIGELLGLPPTGVIVSLDEMGMLKQPADCVVFTPPASSNPDGVVAVIKRLLQAGRNVVSSHVISPSGKDFPMLQEACKQGGSTFHGSGMFPQLVVERFALTLCAALQKVDHIRVVQAMECAQAPREMMASLTRMGLGGPVEAASTAVLQQPLVIDVIAGNVAHHLFGTADVRTECDVRALPAAPDKNHAVAISLIQRAWHDDHCFLTCEQHYFLKPDMPSVPASLPYPAGDTPWHFALEIAGDPGRMDAQLVLEPVADGINPLAHVTAQGILAAIEPVCAAEPGMLVQHVVPGYQLDQRMPQSPVAFHRDTGPRRNIRPAKKQRYRVVIWGPGEIGGAVVRAALQRDDIEIVGAKVFNPQKHGKDLGELVGIGPIGIKATTSKDAIKALKPDCVVVTPQPRAIVEGLDDDVVELLESGINVVTSAAYHNVTMPNWLVSSQTASALLREVADISGMARNRAEELAFAFNARFMKTLAASPLQRGLPLLDRVLNPLVKKAMPFRATPQRLQDACQRGGVSLHGTGVHPTFMAERVGLQLAHMVAQPQHVRFVEAADFSFMPDGMWGGLSTLGFGLPVETLDADYIVARAGDFYYGDVTANVAHLLWGVPSTEVRLERSFRALPAKRDFKVGSLVIKKGGAAALHMTHKGFIGDHHFFTNEECWYLGPEMEFRGDDLPFGHFQTPISYTVEVTGQPSHIRLQLSMDGTGKAAQMRDDADISSADLRCALGQAFRDAGVTNPITNATAMCILDAVGPVCDMAPGVVIDDIQPRFRSW